MSQLSDKGELNVVLNMQQVLSRHDGPQDLGGLVNKYLYIAVLVKEDTGTTQTPPTAPFEKRLSLTLEISSAIPRWNQPGGRVCLRQVCQLTLYAKPGVHVPVHQARTPLQHPGVECVANEPVGTGRSNDRLTN